MSLTGFWCLSVTVLLVHDRHRAPGLPFIHSQSRIPSRAASDRVQRTRGLCLGRGRSRQCGVFDADLPAHRFPVYATSHVLVLLTGADDLLITSLQEGMTFSTHVFCGVSRGGIVRSF
jgi:hypothetical protein